MCLWALAVKSPTARYDCFDLIEGGRFDGLNIYYRNPEYFAGTKETYALIRKLQPHALISFKDGSIMGEDFISPESYMPPFEWEFDTPDRQEIYEKRKHRWSQRHGSGNTEYLTKLREVCTTMLLYHGRDGEAFEDTQAGWINDEKASHLTADQVYSWLTYSRHCGANMLMNIGPRADGSIHPDDWNALVETGKLIRLKGWPKLNNVLK
jgi:alpha-L-fucosidase